MKKIMTICAALIMTANVFAQSPNKMSYQAVIRNASNALVANQAVGMRISILQGTASGTAVYVETQTPTTNANGLASIEIGAGSVNTGTFAAINWANGPYFIKTETDPVGSTNYSIIGTSQLLSVPYALYSKKAEIDNVQDGDTTHWKVNGNNISYNNGNVGIGTTSPISVLEVKSLATASAPGLAISRSISAINNAVPFRFYLNNSANNNFRYAEINGGISSNISGTEQGFISFGVADGTGIWGLSYQQERMRMTNNGLGIGTAAPARNLHVKDVMRLEPRTTSPTSPAKGDIYFDSTLNKLRVYDGTTWQNCW